MRVAYADPPYLGQGSKKYAKQHPRASIWDDPTTYALFLAWLNGAFPDGWALSASSTSLRTLLPLAPQDVRVGAWCKSFCAFKKGVRPAYAWEPVLYRGGRNKAHPPPPKGGKQTTPKDFVVAPITLRRGLTGVKPDSVLDWILDLLNVQQGDTVIDLFPGSGGMILRAFERTGVSWTGEMFDDSVLGL
jgi:hypothetical protein